MRKHWGKTWGELSEELGVEMCGGPEGCRRRLTEFQHRSPRVDATGVIHWGSKDSRSREDHLYVLLIPVALARHPEWRKEPAWLRLYHCATEAWRIAKFELHILLRYPASVKYRQEVRRLAREAKVPLIKTNPSAFSWVHWKPDRDRMKRGGATSGGPLRPVSVEPEHVPAMR